MNGYIPCPNCTQRVYVGGPLVRGPDEHGNEAWICAWCDETVCHECYMTHGSGSHPREYNYHVTSTTSKAKAKKKKKKKKGR